MIIFRQVVKKLKFYYSFMDQVKPPEVQPESVNETEKEEGLVIDPYNLQTS